MSNKSFAVMLQTFGEEEIVLRLPIEKAITHLCVFGAIFVPRWVRSMHPSGRQVVECYAAADLGACAVLFWVATAEEARKNKKRAIEGFKTADEALKGNENGACANCNRQEFL